MTFRDSWCLSPSSWPYCIDELSPPGDKEGQTPGIGTFTPIGLFQGIECTSLSQGEAEEDASETLEATRDWRLGQVLADGGDTGNPSLADAASVASAGTGIVEALATAEGEAADGLYGRLAYVHVSWADLTRLAAAQAITREGRSWRTAAGNVVVASAGYSGLTDSIHVTGEVFAAVSPVETRSALDRSVNTYEAYAEQIGLAVFPPCFNIVVGVT